MGYPHEVPDWAVDVLYGALAGIVMALAAVAYIAIVKFGGI